LFVDERHGVGSPGGWGGPAWRHAPAA
jgi:hypothetical protein